MNKRIFSILAVLSLFMALSALTTYAQAPSGGQRFEVPFEFIVSGKTLPAGKYRVSRFDTQSQHVLRLSSLDGHKTVIFPAIPNPTNDRSDVGKLVFRQYGQKLFLTQVCNVQSSYNHDLPVSRAEKEVIKQTRTGDGRQVAAIESVIEKVITGTKF